MSFTAIGSCQRRSFDPWRFHRTACLLHLQPQHGKMDLSGAVGQFDHLPLAFFGYTPAPQSRATTYQPILWPAFGVGDICHRCHVLVNNLQTRSSSAKVKLIFSPKSGSQPALTAVEPRMLDFCSLSTSTSVQPKWILSQDITAIVKSVLQQNC